MFSLIPQIMHFDPQFFTLAAKYVKLVFLFMFTRGPMTFI